MTRVFLNGSLLEAAAARIDPADRGLLLGDGVFETLAAEEGRIEHLEAHLARLAEGARVIGLRPPNAVTLGQGAQAVLEANGLLRGLASLRITCTRGVGPRGLLPPAESLPTLLITAQACQPPDLSPLSAVTATNRRNDQSPLSRIKCLNYLDQILARQDAAARGADEAVLLNTAGRLACVTAANLFFVAGGRLCTPSLKEGVLPGIQRGQLLELAAALGIGTETGAYQPAELAGAEEAFVTNSLVGIRPLCRIDGATIGAGRPGPVTSDLMAALRRRREG